jgi:hypothetical protein
MGSRSGRRHQVVLATRKPPSKPRLEASPVAASGPDAKRAKTFKLHSARGDDSASELLHDSSMMI